METTTKEISTPELNKIKKNQFESQTIGEFLDWLQNEKGIILCVYDKDVSEHHPYPIRESIEQLLAKYFRIDLQKAEKERVAILDNLRK